jgi:hypothetical protein
VPIGRIEVTMLGVLADVGEVGSGLVGLGHSPMSGKHVQTPRGNSCGVGDVAIEFLIVSASQRQALATPGSFLRFILAFPLRNLVFGITGHGLLKVLALAGYGDATVHGTARASFKTWADECTSFKDAVSEACLVHVEGNKVKAAYARGEFERQRAELMEMWSQHCASSPADTANNVVSLRSA